MSFGSWLKNELTITEEFVEGVIIKIKQGVMIAETDLNDVIKWGIANAPAIATDVTAVAGAVAQVGFAGNPAMAAAVSAAELAVDGLKAAAATPNAGTGNVAANIQAALNVYAAVQTAKGAAATAKAVLAATPTPAQTAAAAPAA